jgi:hypothetical protein
MSKWYNYGIYVSDEESLQEIATSLEALGMIIYHKNANYIKATESARNIEPKEIKNKLEQFADEISAVIHITANDTADTATGTIYELKNGAFEKTRSKFSGGDDSRYDWLGLSYNGLNVDGGKYY